MKMSIPCDSQDVSLFKVTTFFPHAALVCFRGEAHGGASTSLVLFLAPYSTCPTLGFRGEEQEAKQQKCSLGTGVVTVIGALRTSRLSY